MLGVHCVLVVVYLVSTIYLVIKYHYKRIFYINEIQEAVITIMGMLSLMYSIPLDENLFT